MNKTTDPLSRSCLTFEKLPLLKTVFLRFLKLKNHLESTYMRVPTMGSIATATVDRSRSELEISK